MSIRLPFLQFVRPAAADLASALNTLIQRINEGYNPLEWVNPSLKPVSGAFYQPANYGPIVNGGAPSSGTAVFIPVVYPLPFTAVSVSLRVTTGAAGNCQFAIYANHPGTGMPTGAPVRSTGNIDTTNIATVTTALSTPLAVGAGSALGTLFWFGFNIDNTTARLVSSGLSGVTLNMAGCNTAANSLALASGAGLLYFVSATFGTWPTLTGATLSRASGVTILPAFTLEAQ